MNTPIQVLRILCRYQTHGGYTWAGVMSDGELMCIPCLRENYRQVFRATRDKTRDGWAVQGYAGSNDSDSTEYCCNCNKVLWEMPE